MVFLNCFLLFLNFVTSMIEFILWPKYFSTDKRQAEDIGVGDRISPKKPYRVLLHSNLIASWGQRIISILLCMQYLIHCRGSTTDYCWKSEWIYFLNVLKRIFEKMEAAPQIFWVMYLVWFCISNFNVNKTLFFFFVSNIFLLLLYSIPKFP